MQNRAVFEFDTDLAKLKQRYWEPSMQVMISLTKQLKLYEYFELAEILGKLGNAFVLLSVFVCGAICVCDFPFLIQISRCAKVH